jgi:hypothetical protein
MTQRHETPRDPAGASPPVEPLHRLLAHLRQPAAGPEDPHLRALLAEIDARETRAYASGWQDAIEALRGGPTA